MKEIWKDIESFKGVYQISSWGRVRRTKAAQGSSLGIRKWDTSVKNSRSKTFYKGKGSPRMMLTDADSKKKVRFTKRELMKCYF